MLFLLSASTFGANDDLLDDIEIEERLDQSTEVAPQLFNETVNKISPSKKIFIITNENQSFSKGDFISILLSNQLVFRALVAKSTEEKIAGIKLIKIYSSQLFSQLRSGKEILILKGDDSFYSVKKTVDPKKEEEKIKSESKIQSEEDLFNSTTLSGEDDLTLEENNKRLIKTDNLLSINYGLLESKDNDGASTRYPHLNGTWGYQMSENIWGELTFGTNTIRDYPNANGDGGLDTRLMSFSLKFKYVFSAPFYSYIMPYAGYQMVLADSPGAGKYDASNPQSQTTLDLEASMVNELEKSGPVFGVTILRRIVPGWFARADLGSDIIGGGLCLEF